MKTFLSFLGLLSVALAAAAADLKSGPEIGAAVPMLEVHDVTGAHAGKKVDYPGQRKGAATVYVLLREEDWSRPMARYLRELDEAVTKQNTGAYVVAVWLTADKDKTKAYLPRAQQSLAFKSCALTFFPGDGDAAGPAAWQLNDRASVTAVVVAKGKVTARFAYVSLNETDVPAVFKALEAAGK